MTYRVFQLAAFTVRQRWGSSMLLLVVLAVVLPIAAAEPHTGPNLVLGLGAFGGVAYACFLGAVVVAHEVDARSIYAVLAKPISRQTFFIGRVIGGLSILIGYWLLLGLTAVALRLLHRLPLDTLFFQTVLLVGLNLGLYFALPCALSVVTTPIAAGAFVAFLALSIGKVSDLGHRSGLLGAVNRAVHWILPPLDHLRFSENVRLEVAAPAGSMLLLGSDVVLYGAIVLAVATAAFGRRELAR